MKFNELKFKEATFKSEDGSFIIKEHLLADEIVTIAQMMLKEDNYMTREMTKGILLVHFCTDIEVEFDGKDIIVDQKNYDLYNSNGIIKEIENTIDERDLEMIDSYIMHEESINKIIKDFCDGMNTKIDEYSKNINLENTIKMLKEAEAIGNK